MVSNGWSRLSLEMSTEEEVRSAVSYYFMFEKSTIRLFVVIPKMAIVVRSDVLLWTIKNVRACTTGRPYDAWSSMRVIINLVDECVQDFSGDQIKDYKTT